MTRGGIGPVPRRDAAGSPQPFGARLRPRAAIRGAVGAAPLLQERFGLRDPWRVAAVCCLLNRARGRRADPVLRELFRRWPSASRFRRDAERADVLALVRPLGFHRSRTRALFATARAASDGRALRRPSRVARLAGCDGVGPYAVASMRAFCLGDLTATTADRVLAARLEWLRGCGGER